MAKTPIEKNLEKIDKAVADKNQPRLKALMQNLTENIKNESGVGISEEVRQQIKTLVSSLELEAIIQFPTIVADLENIKIELGMSLKWMEKVNEILLNDPLFKALFFDNENETDQAIIEKINQFGYLIKSKKDLVKIVKNSILETTGKDIPDEEVLSASKIFNAINSEEEFAELKGKLISELGKAIPTPPPPPADAFEPEDDKGGVPQAQEAQVRPSIVVETSEPLATPTPPSPPVEAVKPATNQMVAPEPQKDNKTRGKLPLEKTPEQKRAEYLEKLAKENAPDEFKNWTRLYHALHQKNLRNKPEKTINAIKKNRVIWLGASDENSFHKLRAFLNKDNFLKKLIEAENRTKAWEVKGGVENLNEKNIKKFLTEIVDEVRKIIGWAKLEIAKLAVEQKNETSVAAVVEAPVKTEKTIQAKYTSDAKGNVRLEPPVRMKTEPKNIPEENRQSVGLEQNLQSIERAMDEMPFSQKKQDIIWRLARIIGNTEISETQELPQVSLAPTEQGREIKEKPDAKKIVEILLTDQSLKALIDELEVVRNIMANREFTIKFGLTNKAFGGIKDFERKAKRMESNDDPMIRAASKEELLMEHVNVALEQNPKLVESWDPSSSPGKVAVYFKKMWTEYLTRIKS